MYAKKPYDFPLTGVLTVGGEVVIEGEVPKRLCADVVTLKEGTNQFELSCGYWEIFVAYDGGVYVVNYIPQTANRSSDSELFQKFHKRRKNAKT